ncbi:MAG TPA: ribonuclease domain-containing protein, partial [Turneriella sp.]|nr:ribonuclease domain-containing protein [Turneriella sp.]
THPVGSRSEQGDGGMSFGQRATAVVMLVAFVSVNCGSGFAPGSVPSDLADNKEIIISALYTGLPTGTVYYSHNHLGSGALVTDENGDEIFRITYTEYGEIDLHNSGKYNSETGEIEHHIDAALIAITAVKYTGQEYDPETGFYYYNARYYDPQLGLFTTPDTVFDQGAGSFGFNRHMYVGGNPIMYSDPTGHNAEEAGRWDEKGNERVQESSQSESGWQRNEERSGKSEASGVESARESQGGSSAREHADVDRGDRGERAAASSSNASDNSQLNQMISSITSTQFDTGSTGGTPLLIAQAAPVPVTTPGSGPVATDTGSSTADTNGDLPTYAKFAGVTVAVVAVIVLAVKFKNWGAARAAAGQTGMNVARALAGSNGTSSQALTQRIQQTLQNIKSGNLPFAKDGTIFLNREGLLPSRAAGYYREFTVQNPALKTRGMERIVTGQQGEVYFTPNHYKNFIRIQ